jgi:polysaccharide biosynthesis protein VpsM
MRTRPVGISRDFYLRLVSATICLGAINRARAFVTTGPDDELFATGVASAQVNDNLFLSHTNEKTDELFDLVPGLEFDYGKNSLTKGSLSVNEDIQLFATHSSLDTGLTNAVFSALYDDSKLKLNFDATFHQVDQATLQVNQGVLVKRDLYHVDGTGEIALTDKTSVSAGAIYDDTDYLKTGYTDWQWVKIPLNYYYEVEPKLDASAGFAFQNNQLSSGGLNGDEYFYNVGARGQFTPKLTGQLNVGYEQLEFDKGGSEGGLGVDSSFTYAYSPKTTLTFGVNNDFGYSALNGAAYRLLSPNVGLNAAISEQWKFTAMVSYGRYDYITTSELDNFYTGQVGITYIVNAYCSLTGSYGYLEDISNITAQSFTQNLFTISTNLKF